MKRKELKESYIGNKLFSRNGFLSDKMSDLGYLALYNVIHGEDVEEQTEILRSLLKFYISPRHFKEDVRRLAEKYEKSKSNEPQGIFQLADLGNDGLERESEIEVEPSDNVLRILSQESGDVD
jgi:hypothetical protein